jgi:hypothetical protein
VLRASRSTERGSTPDGYDVGRSRTPRRSGSLNP